MSHMCQVNTNLVPAKAIKSLCKVLMSSLRMLPPVAHVVTFKIQGYLFWSSKFWIKLSQEKAFHHLSPFPTPNQKTRSQQKHLAPASRFNDHLIEAKSLKSATRLRRRIKALHNLHPGAGNEGYPKSPAGKSTIFHGIYPPKKKGRGFGIWRCWFTKRVPSKKLRYPFLKVAFGRLFFLFHRCDDASP